MPQWIRKIALEVSGGSGLSVTNIIIKVRFHITQVVLETPGILDIRIYNLDNDRIKPIMKEFKEVTLSAGYENGLFGTIFKGTVKQVRLGKESPTDTFCEIYAAGGDVPYNTGVTNKQFKPGSTAEDHLKEHVKSMQGLELGHYPKDLFQGAKYPRSVTFLGKSSHYLRELAYGLGCTWFIDSVDGKTVNVLPAAGKNTTLPSGAVELNSTTGLIGIPVQTIDGIIATCLINPTLKAGGRVKINQKDINPGVLNQQFVNNTDNAAVNEPLGINQHMPSIAADGIYKILSIEVEADTRGNEWYQTLTCISVNPAEQGQISPALANSAALAGVGSLE